jgi:hypothetical protein
MDFNALKWICPNFKVFKVREQPCELKQFLRKCLQKMLSAEAGSERV